MNNSPAKHSRGFTLVELLAVIAIIGILAAIVVPNVARYIGRAQVARAVSEIKNADTATAGMLSDAGRSKFKDFLRTDAGNSVGLGRLTTIHQAIVQAGDGGNLSAAAAAIQQALDFYNEMFYELLRQGKDSDFATSHLVPEVRQKLGPSYMDIGQDPWGEPYQFWLGAKPRGLDLVILRSYRLYPDVDPGDPDFSEVDAYVWNSTTRSDEDLFGQPKADAGDYNGVFSVGTAYGYPAAKDLHVYIFSKGPNQVIDAVLPIQIDNDMINQAPEFLGGGDDPNNWDNESGWANAPR